MTNRWIGATFALTLGLTIANPTWAQDGTATEPTTQESTTSTPATAVPLSDLVTSLSRASNAVVLADRSVAREQVTLPASGNNAQTLEQMLTTITRSLPAGTVFARVYLPMEGNSTSAARFNADTVTDYILIQSRLFGASGTASSTTPSAGTVEIMGKQLSGNGARRITETLNLKPVYVLFNPTRRAAMSDTATPSTPSTTTPDSATGATTPTNPPATDSTP